MFAWAEDGIFPAAVAAVHPRFRTPHVAILLSAGMATIGIVGCHLAGDWFLGVDILVTSMLINFLLMGLAVLALPARNPGLAAAMSVLPSPAARVGVAAVAVVVLAVFLAVHTWRDLSSGAAWYFEVHAGVGDRDGPRLRGLLAGDAPAAGAGCGCGGTLRGAAAGVTTSMSSIDKVDLAQGLSISRVVTGLWQIADMERGGRTLDLDATARAMHPYIDAGFTSFDMADHYGSAELIAGRARPHEGEGGAHVQLFTKWVPPPGPVTAAAVACRGRAIAPAAARSGHRPAAVPRLELCRPVVARRAVPSHELRQEGLVRHLGLTNVDAAHLRLVLASGIPVVSNQVSASLVDRRAAGGLAAVCQEFDVSLLAYGTLCGGWLSDRWLGASEPDWEQHGTWSQMKYGRFIRVAGGWPALQRVLRAAGRGRSPRRVDRQRGDPLRDAAAGGGGGHRRSPPGRARRTSTTTRDWARSSLDERRSPAHWTPPSPR